MHDKTKNGNREKRLVENAQKDPEKFSEIYIEYFPKIYGFVYRRVNKKHLVDDFVSDIFENAFKSLPDFQWQGVSFSAWIFRIARNYIIDYYRKSGRIKGEISLEAISEIIKGSEKSAGEEIDLDEELITLYNALREFTEEDQYLIYYKFFEDMSNKEISDVLGMSETNVGTRLYRLRNKLKKFMQKKK